MISVLYVDDELGLLEITKLFLEEGGFAVDITMSPLEALNLIAKNNYDVVISDYQMPKMTGIELLKKIRKNFSNKPFILFTGKGREEVVIEALNNGADFYLQKGGEFGATFAELMHKIRKAADKEKEALKNSEKQLKINFKTFIDLLIKINLESSESKIEEILKKVFELLNIDGAYIASVENDELKIHEFIGIRTKEFKEMVVRSGYGVGPRVIVNGVGEIINHYLDSDKFIHDKNVDRAVELEGIVSAMVVLVFSLKGRKEVLYAFTRANREFLEDDLNLLLSFSSLIAIKVKDNQMSLDLKQKNKKLDLMTRMTRHAINNDITVVANYLSLAMEMKEEEKKKEYILKAKDGVNRMAQEIKNMSDYQEMGLNSPQWYLTDSIEDYYRKKCNKLIFINEAKGLEFFMDPIGIKVIGEFVRNTIKYGGEFVSKVILRYEAQPDNSIIFFYEDDGPGIEPENKNNIFGNGYGKGSGFGLFLAREVLALTGMEIKETGEYGRGARFEIRIPAGSYRIKK